MLVSSSALRTPLGYASRKKTEDPYTMLEARFTPRTVFMEIGSTDQTLALRAATYVERVYSIDVSGQLAPSRRAPCNLRLVGCDGVRIPVPQGTVDIAWSGDFLDRLQPEAGAEHLQSVQRALANGGEYLFTTQQPVAEVRKLVFAAGFSVVRVSLLSLLLKPVRITAIK